MNPRSLRRSGIGWSASAFVLALLLFMQLIGAFDEVDGRVYDWFHQFTAAKVNDRAVLLVECHPTILDRDNPRLKQLLHTIDEASPRKIGVVSERTPISLRELDVVGISTSIVEGRPAQSIADADLLHNRSIQVGFSELSFATQPIFRFAQLHSHRDREPIHSFEHQLAAEFGFSSAPSQIGIRFGNSVRAIPCISANQILSRNFLPEMIHNRIVIIGERLPENLGVCTPASNLEPMSRLELRGHTVLNLVQRNWISKLTLAKSAGILICLWLCLCVVLRPINHRRFLVVSFAFAAVSLTMSFAGVLLFSTLLPVSSMLMLTTWIPSCMWIEKLEILKSVVAAQKIKLNANRSTASTYEQSEPWQKIATAMLQFFGPSRIALFKVDAATRRLKLVRANGSVEESEVFERRRDFSRSPWHQSIDFGQATRNQSRRIFSSPNQTQVGARSPEIQCAEFIAPLVFGTRILGFIVLEMNSEVVDRWSDFEHVLHEFAEDFAQLIAEREKAVKDKRRWTPELTFPEQIDAEQVMQLQDSIDDAIAKVEQAFESDSCCRMLLNAFGQVIKANAKMSRRLDSDTPVSTLDFIAILQLLAGIDECEARNAFRAVIVSNQKTKLQTKAADLAGTITLSPVAWDHHTGRDLFSRGILLEIHDREKNRHQIKHVREHELDQDEAILRNINKLINANQDFTSSPKEQSIDSVWKSALFNVRPRLQKKNIGITDEFPNTQLIEIPNPECVAQTIEVCLGVLVDCSHQSQTIRAHLALDQSWCKLTLRNGAKHHTGNWNSPQLLGENETFSLHKASEKMQSIGGRLSFQDTTNGELLIEATFAASAASLVQRASHLGVANV